MCLKLHDSWRWRNPPPPPGEFIPVELVHWQPPPPMYVSEGSSERPSSPGSTSCSSKSDSELSVPCNQCKPKLTDKGKRLCSISLPKINPLRPTKFVLPRPGLTGRFAKIYTPGYTFGGGLIASPPPPGVQWRGHLGVMPSGPPHLAPSSTRAVAPQLVQLALVAPRAGKHSLRPGAPPHARGTPSAVGIQTQAHVSAPPSTTHAEGS